MAYLLLGLPFGIFYFTFLVTALSVGVGLVVVWVGVPILLGTVVAWRAMGRFERRFLTAMMGGEIEPAPTLSPEPNWWERAKAVIADSYTYRSFFWLLLRFPFGIAGFVIVVVGLSVPLSLMAAPIILAFPESWELGWIESVSWLVWLLPVIGILLAGVVAQVINGFAVVHMMVGRPLLGPSARQEVARERKRADVAEERTRLAHELHDSVGHTLTMMVVQAGAGGHVYERDPEFAKQALANIEQSGRTALGELDRILGILREDDAVERAPRPGLSKVPVLVEDLSSAGLPVELRLEGSTGDVPGETSRSAYRIVQEALTNVLKHAGNVPTSITIHRGAGAVEIEVLNDPAPSGAVGTMNGEGGGRGLIGIEERVAMLGGSVEHGHRPGGGFRVWARLPIDGADR
jgi:signal transduction histidine kinase